MSGQQQTTSDRFARLQRSHASFFCLSPVSLSPYHSPVRPSLQAIRATTCASSLLPPLHALTLWRIRLTIIDCASSNRAGSIGRHGMYMAVRANASGQPSSFTRADYEKFLSSGLLLTRRLHRTQVVNILHLFTNCWLWRRSCSSSNKVSKYRHG